MVKPTHRNRTDVMTTSFIKLLILKLVGKKSELVPTTELLNIIKLY